MSTNASVSSCCPITLAEGCQVGGTARWVSIRNADGTISVVNPATGATVAPANVLAFCPPQSSLSHFQTVGPNSVFVIPNTADLESWSVRARVAGVTVDVSGGGANALDANEVVESEAQDDDVLTDVVTITTDATGSARVLWLERV